MSKTPFVMEPQLTAIVQQYTNESYIADAVLPRTLVNTQEYKYTVHAKREGFALPDTSVGRTGRVNEIEFSGTQATGSAKDYGLEDPIPMADIENAKGQPIDPRDVAAENLIELVALGREKRVADKVFAAATYPTGNKVTLSGTGQWSDFTNSDPVNAMLAAMDLMIMRPNQIILGQGVWTKLRQHPKIVKAVHGNSGDSGVANRAQVAELLEVSELLIGAAWADTANPGQTAAYSRLWGNHCAMLHKNPRALGGKGVTFGGTFQWGPKVGMSQQDSTIGLRGGIRVRVGESVEEQILASDTGYLFTNAVA